MWQKKISVSPNVKTGSRRYLGLYPNLDEAADDGEQVADDQQDVPAVNELHPVRPADTAAKFVTEKLHIFLIEECGNNQQSHT